VLDNLMPIKDPVGMYVGYRSVRDYVTSELEYSFVIGYAPDKRGYGLDRSLSAHVRMADSVSVHDQIMKIHIAAPAEDAGSIQQGIKLKVANLTEESCPAIRTQMNKLQQLDFRIPSIKTDEIIIHPLNHEFHVQTGMGNMNFNLVDEEHPMVKWALETQHALEACIPSQPK
jgi:uncharacterized protein YlaN (UPF0358 family)